MNLVKHLSVSALYTEHMTNDLNYLSFHNFNLTENEPDCSQLIGGSSDTSGRTRTFYEY